MLLQKAQETQTLAFVDVDGTIAGYSEAPTQAEIDARAGTREILDEETGLTLSTMRTPELCMSEGVYEASKRAGFNRQAPLCFVDKDQRLYKPLNTILKYTHNLDPHCISNPGTGIWVYKDGAYYHDKSFFVQKKIDDQKWRANVEALLEVVDSDCAIRRTFSKLEDPNSYANGATDVETLACRFELRYTHPEGGEQWKTFVKERVNSLRGTTHPLASIAHSIEIVDESVPVTGRYQLYLVPRRLTKEGASNHILRSVSEESGIPTHKFTMITFGDRMPDLKAGLMGGGDAVGFFLLAGGSPLTEYLVGDKRGQDFAGQSLKSIVRRLKPMDNKGFYLFNMYGMPRPRIVVIADQAFSGTKDAESVYEFLKLIKAWSKK